MENLQKIFSNRELAYLFWYILITSFLLLKNIRDSVGKVIISFFANKLTFLYISMLTYTCLEVLIIYKIGLWNSNLIKDSILWFITFSFLTLFKSIKARTVKDFIPILNDVFKLTIFFEFIINLSSFNLIIEIILLPIITFFGIAQVISKQNKNETVSNFLSNFLSIIGFFYLLFSIFKTVKNYDKFSVVENLNILILPVLLSFFSLPFFYLIALYNEYEQIFMRVKYMTKIKKNQNKIKRQIIMKAKFNLNTIALLRDKLINFDLYETDDIKIYLDKIKG